MNKDTCSVNKPTKFPESNLSYNLKVPTIFPSYHASTSDALYGNGLIHYNIKMDDVKYPIIQNIGPYKHCLICAQSLSSELFHCNSDSHINNMNSPHIQHLLRKYHNVFVKLPIKYQLQQKYFRKEEELHCILCSVSVPYDSKLILDHVQNREHIFKQESFEMSPGTSRDGSPVIKRNIGTPKKKTSRKRNKKKDDASNNSNKNFKLEISDTNGISDITDSLNKTTATIQNTFPFMSSKKTPAEQKQPKFLEYLPEAKEKLFLNLEAYTVLVNGTYYFTLRHSMLGIRCILCNDAPAVNISEHLKTSNHMKQLESKKALCTLKGFHDVWMFDKVLQIHQFYFIQRYCHVCQEMTADDEIKKHVLLESHLENISKAQILICTDETKTNGQIQTQIQLSREVPIIATTSKASTPEEDLLENPGIKRNHIGLGKNIEIRKVSNEVTEITLNYVSWIKETIYCGLAQYIVTVDDIKYPYLRRTLKGLRCILCEDVAIDNLDEHVNSKDHLKLMDTPSAQIAVQQFHNFWTECQYSPEHQNNQVYVINGRCAFCCYSDDEDLQEHIASKEHRIMKDADSFEDILERMGIGNKFQYCEEADMAFYKEMSNHWTYYGTIRLPLLRVTTEGIRCILCDDAGVAVPSQHVEASGHKQALQDNQKLDKLRRFHKMWQNMSPQAQMHQQHVILMMCIACDKKLTVETGEAHVLSKLHEGNLKLKQEKRAKPTNTKKHDIRESAINPESAHMIDHLPAYLSIHLKSLMHAENEHYRVKCTPCDQAFTKLIDLRNHLQSKSHCTITKLHQYRGKFFCEICAMYYGTERSWLDHLSHDKHTERIRNLGDSRKANVKEHTCHTCHMVIFGDVISCLRHGRNDKVEREVKVTLSKSFKSLLSSKKNICDTAQELLKKSEEELEKSMEKVEECCAALEKALSNEFPNCHAYPFGSRVTGLGNKQSDLDVFIDIGIGIDGMYDGSEFQSAVEQASIVKDVGELLKMQKKHFLQVNMVPGARTPIVQVLHVDTEIDCDISFRHGLSVENTEFIKFCLDLQPIAKPAMLFLKDWLVKCDLAHNILTSYAFILLLIFFLQRSNYLLSVVEIRNISKSEGPIIDGWEAICYNTPIEEMRTYIKKCDMPIPELLKMFFAFYSNFDFNNSVVCPLLGRSLNKFHFQPRKPHLPVEMESYIKKMNSSNPEQFRYRTPMCVQDPFDLSHNVTKACSDIFVKTFQKYCQISKSLISALK